MKKRWFQLLSLLVAVTMLLPLPVASYAPPPLADAPAGESAGTSRMAFSGLASAPELDVAKCSAYHGKQIEAGETFHYCLSYVNTGDETAYNVVITDTLPPYIEFVRLDTSALASTARQSCGSGDSATGKLEFLPAYRLDAIAPQSAGCDAVPGGFVCEIPEVAPGEDRCLNIEARVKKPLPATGVACQVNEDYVIDCDNCAGEVVGRTQVEVCPMGEPELWVSKSRTPSTAELIAPLCAAPLITYTLEYGNSGNQGARNVEIQDQIPANTSFVSASAGGTRVGGNIRWQVGTVAGADEQNGAVSFVVRVNTPLQSSPTVISNCLYSITSPDGGAATVTTCVQTTVRDEPQVAISKTADKSRTEPFDIIEFTLHYSNTGCAIAREVTIVDELPANTTFIEASDGGSYDAATGEITWQLGTLNPGATGQVTFLVKVNATLPECTTDIRNDNYRITTAQGGGATGAPVIIPVDEVAVLEITKSSPQVDTAVTCGDLVQYVFEYENTADIGADDVVITDTLPAELTCVSTLPCRCASPQEIKCTIGAVAGGVGGVVTATARVNSPLLAGTRQINNDAAYIFCDAGCAPCSGSQAPGVAVPVTGSPALHVRKTVNRQSVNPGDEFVYTIEYWNDGCIGAREVVVYDELPEYTSFVSATPEYRLVGNRIEWDVSKVEADGVHHQVQLTLRAQSLPYEDPCFHNRVYGIESPDGGDSMGEGLVYPCVYPVIDLYLHKTTALTMTAPGEIITYTLHYTNVGNTPALNTVIADPVPEHTTFVSGDNCNRVGDDIRCDVAELAPGVSGQVDILVQVDKPLPAGVRQICNDDYTISSDEGSGDYDIHIAPAEVCLPLTAPVTLEIRKTTDVASVRPHELLTYTIHYTLNSDVGLTNAELAEQLPADTTYISAPGARKNNNTLTWDVGDLESGTQDEVQFTVRVSDGLCVFTPSIVNRVYDIWGYDTMLQHITATGAPVRTPLKAHDVVLSAQKLPREQLVEPGSVADFEIVVHNMGKGRIAAVEVFDDLTDFDPAVTAIDPMGWDAYVGNQGAVWQIGEMAAGETVTVPLRLGIHPNTVPGVYTNVVRLHYDDLCGTTTIPDQTARVVVTRTPCLTTTIRADYEQMLTDIFTATGPGTVTLELTNPYTDLPASFVPAQLYLREGQSRDFPLVFNAADALTCTTPYVWEPLPYHLTATRRITNVEWTSLDVVTRCLLVNVLCPDIDFDMGLDCLSNTLWITNTGRDAINDLSVGIENAVGGALLFQGGGNHIRLEPIGAGSVVSITVVPQPAGVTADIVARAREVEKTQRYDCGACAEFVTCEYECVSMQLHNSSRFCANLQEPFSMTFDLPANFSYLDVRDAKLLLDYNLYGTVSAHSLYYRINNQTNWQPLFENAAPRGRLEFVIANFAHLHAGRNVVYFRSENVDGGRLYIVQNVELRLCLNNYTEQVCKEPGQSDEEACPANLIDHPLIWDVDCCGNCTYTDIVIDRAYANPITNVTFINTDSVTHTYWFSLSNREGTTLIGGIVGPGSSAARPVTIGPHQVITLFINLSAQDVTRYIPYEHIMDLYVTRLADGKLWRADCLRVKVRPPEPEIKAVLDGMCITDTLWIANLGDVEITDLNVFARDIPGGTPNFADYISFVPERHHAKLDAGEVISAAIETISPPDGRGLHGVIIVAAMGEELASIPYDCDCTPYTETLECVMGEFRNDGWYCTNRPHIDVEFFLPTDVITTRINNAKLVLDYILGFRNGAYSDVNPHSVYISVNGHPERPLFENRVPTGTQYFEIKPEELRPGRNVVHFYTTHLNGGHYVVTTDMILQVCMNDYTVSVCLMPGETITDAVATHPIFREDDCCMDCSLHTTLSRAANQLVPYTYTNSAEITKTLIVSAENLYKQDIWGEFVGRGSAYEPPVTVSALATDTFNMEVDASAAEDHTPSAYRFDIYEITYTLELTPSAPRLIDCARLTVTECRAVPTMTASCDAVWITNTGNCTMTDLHLFAAPKSPDGVPADFVERISFVPPLDGVIVPAGAGISTTVIADYDETTEKLLGWLVAEADGERVPTLYDCGCPNWTFGTLTDTAMKLTGRGQYGYYQPAVEIDLNAPKYLSLTQIQSAKLRVALTPGAYEVSPHNLAVYISGTRLTPDIEVYNAHNEVWFILDDLMLLQPGHNEVRLEIQPRTQLRRLFSMPIIRRKVARYTVDAEVELYLCLAEYTAPVCLMDPTKTATETLAAQPYFDHTREHCHGCELSAVIDRDYQQLVTDKFVYTNTSAMTQAVSAYIIDAGSGEVFGDFIGIGGAVGERAAILSPGDQYTFTLSLNAAEASNFAPDYYVKCAELKIVTLDEQNKPVDWITKTWQCICITVRPPGQRVELGIEGMCITDTLWITNHGGLLTDFSLEVAAEQGGHLYLTPQMQHARLEPGEIRAVQIVPYYNAGVENLTATIIARAAGISWTIPYTCACTPQTITATCVAGEIEKRDWYCDNRPVITVGFDLPPDIAITQVANLELELEFNPRGRVPSHTLSVQLNGGAAVSVFAETTPVGKYYVKLNPNVLEVGRNELVFDSRWHELFPTLNPGHYVVFTGIRLRFCQDDYRAMVCAPPGQELTPTLPAFLHPSDCCGECDYHITISRTYNQVVRDLITYTNDTDAARMVHFSLQNIRPESRLVGDFVGKWSAAEPRPVFIDQIITPLLALHAQNVRNFNADAHVLTVDVTYTPTGTTKPYKRICVTVEPLTPCLHAAIVDPCSPTATLWITNCGTSGAPDITDLAVYAVDTPSGTPDFSTYLEFYPRINHARLRAGEVLTTRLNALAPPGIARLQGEIVLEALGQRVPLSSTLEYSCDCPTYTIPITCAELNLPLEMEECLNISALTATFNLRHDLQPAQINSAKLEVNFHPRAMIPRLDIDIAVNGTTVYTITAARPHGRMYIMVPPELLHAGENEVVITSPQIAEQGLYGIQLMVEDPTLYICLGNYEVTECSFAPITETLEYFWARQQFTHSHCCSDCVPINMTRRHDFRTSLELTPALGIIGLSSWWELGDAPDGAVTGHFENWLGEIGAGNPIQIEGDTVALTTCLSAPYVHTFSPLPYPMEIVQHPVGESYAPLPNGCIEVYVRRPQFNLAISHTIVPPHIYITATNLATGTENYLSDVRFYLDNLLDGTAMFTRCITGTALNHTYAIEPGDSVTFALDIDTELCALSDTTSAARLQGLKDVADSEISLRGLIGAAAIGESAVELVDEAVSTTPTPRIAPLYLPIILKNYPG